MRTMIEKIRGLREDNDLTQQQLADVLGTSQTMYARYERGANEVPLRHIVTLCKFYNVSADYLLGTTPNPLKKQKTASLSIAKTARK
ncbi:MAG: helix-turn-helix transcriptional regulator [Ruminococcaceae bacterium]|nr:helix-turn-helix transcriptional regulator [Oscillospiraceae bacterium]